MTGAILQNLALLAIGVFILIYSGIYVVRTVSAILRMSEFVLSVILLSFATSLAELTVGVRSALSGIPEVSLGDVLGTNIVNLSLILGLVAIVGGGVKLEDYRHFLLDRPYFFLFILSPTVLLLDGVLSRIDGAILLSLFLWNMARITREREHVVRHKSLRYHHARHVGHTVADRREFFHNVTRFLVAAPLLVVAAQIIVTTVQNVAGEIGIPEFVIALYAISVGTSLPEMTVGLRSALAHKTGMSLGNLFGAATLNSTLVLGVVSLIAPITDVDLGVVRITGVTTAFVMLAVFSFLLRKSVITRSQGIILLLMNAAFLVWQAGFLL